MVAHRTNPVAKKIYIQRSPGKGRGVFAKTKIRKGSVIEICPALVFPKKNCKHLDKTPFFSYYFEWEKRTGALLLGYGSLYNHSDTPNAEVEKEIETQKGWIMARKDIEADEEITIDYRGGDKSRELWFEVK